MEIVQVNFEHLKRIMQLNDGREGHRVYHSLCLPAGRQLVNAMQIAFQ